MYIFFCYFLLTFSSYLKVVAQRNIGDHSFSRKTNFNEMLLVSSAWSWHIEEVGVSGNNSFTVPGLLEQINTTKDTSDYLWYTTR